MAFVTKKRTVFNYQSPVAMYHDNKSANKTIMGLLDYQRDMLEERVKNKVDFWTHLYKGS